MLRRLRIKITCILVGVSVMLFAVIFITLNIFMRINTTRTVDAMLEMLVELDLAGMPLTQIQEGVAQFSQRVNSGQLETDMLRFGRLFYIKLDSDGELEESYLEMMFDFSQQEALEYTRRALATGQEKGTLDNYRYLVREGQDGTIAVFAESSAQTQLLNSLMHVSLFSAGITCLLCLLFSFLFSRWAVGPVETAFNKQKQFISDASHELKTPLTIISANADFLENEIGENTRLMSIKSQTRRMSSLVYSLLDLAKTDEEAGQTVMARFDLSRAVLSSTLEFESRAFEESRSLTYDIENDIFITCDEQRVKQLAGILIDNAISYSDMNGDIRVTLTGAGRPQLSVYNTGKGIREDETGRIFDRFYRADDSRSRDTGGYGLGLAIAKSITDSFKGEIAVTGRQGQWVMFTVTF